jgi:hypothetical protein
MKTDRYVPLPTCENACCSRVEKTIQKSKEIQERLQYTKPGLMNSIGGYKSFLGENISNTP